MHLSQCFSRILEHLPLLHWVSLCLSCEYEQAVELHTSPLHKANGLFLFRCPFVLFDVLWQFCELVDINAESIDVLFNPLTQKQSQNYATEQSTESWHILDLGQSPVWLMNNVFSYLKVVRLKFCTNQALIFVKLIHCQFSSKRSTRLPTCRLFSTQTNLVYELHFRSLLVGGRQHWVLHQVIHTCLTKSKESLTAVCFYNHPYLTGGKLDCVCTLCFQKSATGAAAWGITYKLSRVIACQSNSGRVLQGGQCQMPIWHWFCKVTSISQGAVSSWHTPPLR